jgi:Mg2+-importing ATPase
LQGKGKRRLQLEQIKDEIRFPWLDLRDPLRSLDTASHFATLTGESLPVEKHDTPDTRPDVASIEHSNICFLGTSVESGAATAVIVATGTQTYFGKMAASLAGQQTETAFDRGVKKYIWLMLSFMLVMVPMVFFINGLFKHNWKNAFFFAMAVAVGLTPKCCR